MSISVLNRFRVNGIPYTQTIDMETYCIHMRDKDDEIILTVDSVGRLLNNKGNVLGQFGIVSTGCCNFTPEDSGSMTISTGNISRIKAVMKVFKLIASFKD